jgi:hypothetical protein
MRTWRHEARHSRERIWQTTVIDLRSSSMDAQSVSFGVKAHLVELNPANGTASDNDHHCLNGFQTLSEARSDLDRLFQRVSRFLDIVNSLPAEERLSSACHPDLEERQRELRIQLAEYRERLNRSEAWLLRSGRLKEQRGIDLIRLHHRTFSVLLETYLTGGADIICDAYLVEFKEMVASSERIAHSF